MDDVEVIDVENYNSSGDKTFSHQQLVMRAFNKVIELGTKEMHPGVNEVSKGKEGATKVIYKEDTQKAFIESIKMLKAIMICDFDKEANDKINKYLTVLGSIKFHLLKEQMDWFNKLKQGQKDQLVNSMGVITKWKLKEQLEHYWIYREQELEYYRKVLEELTEITSRKDFYTEEIFEA